MFRYFSRPLTCLSRYPYRADNKWLKSFSTQSSAAQSLSVNSPVTNLTVLNNGIRVASEDSGLATATVGVWIEAGSRYEKPNVNGVAHFMEHMAFKGTNKRSQSDLEMEIEDMGAQLNAYTSREQTVFYCKCLSKDIPRAMDIISDIIQNAKLGEAEIERERSVILREMQEVESNLQEVVFDYLHMTAYQGTPLANTILGPTENIRKISQRDLKEYLEDNYKASRIVVAGAGGVRHDELVDVANKCLGKISNTYPGEIPLVTKCRYTGSELEERDDALPLAHVVMAVEGTSWTNPDTYALMVASTLIGMWDRSQANAKQHSNPIVRVSHEQGLCHQFQAFNTCYQDTGLWGVYYVSERMKVGEMTHVIQDEWMRLCTTVRDAEVERAKSQLIANTLLHLDSTSAVCEDIGRQMLTYGRRILPHEIIYRIQSITTEELKRVCYNYIYDVCPVVSAIGPTEAIPDYNLIRSEMHWHRV